MERTRLVLTRRPGQTLWIGATLVKFNPPKYPEIVGDVAKEWTVSPDGKTYTFKLRDDVTFCSGKKFTAEDVVYTFTRLKAPETRAPFGWRAGEIASLRAIDATTVSYELKEPFSDLLLQLTMFTNNIVNKDNKITPPCDKTPTGQIYPTPLLHRRISQCLSIALHMFPR
jgi:ABC-type transport system substrate-binding protein